jgi:multidrug transporter EmrE-like cation transporter
MSSVTTSQPADFPAPKVHKTHGTNPVYLVLGCTVFAAAAQVLMKFGAMHTMPAMHISDPDSVMGFLRALAGNWQLLLGYTMHACNAFLLILALRDGELSMLYPIIALTYVWVILLSMYFFHDQLNVWKCGGIVLVMAGVALLGVTSQRR